MKGGMKGKYSGQSNFQIPSADELNPYDMGKIQSLMMLDCISNVELG